MGGVVGSYSKKRYEKNIKCVGERGRNRAGSKQGGYRKGGAIGDRVGDRAKNISKKIKVFVLFAQIRGTV